MDITINIIGPDAPNPIEINTVMFALFSNKTVLATAPCDSNGNITFTNVQTDGTSLTLGVDMDYYQTICNQPPFSPSVAPFSITLMAGANPIPLPYGVNWVEGNVIKYRYAYFSLSGEFASSEVLSYAVTSDSSQRTSGPCPTLEIMAYTGTVPENQIIGINVYRQVVANGVEQPEFLLATFPNIDVTYLDALC